jgi:glycosyltransferase involved in cell wall biosynthesis
MTRNDAIVQREATHSKKILVLTPQFPYPPHQGTTLRNYNLIAGLAQRHEVHLLAFGEPAESRGTPLDDLCRSVKVVRPPRRSMGQRMRGLFLSRLPDMALRLPSTEFQAALAATLDDERPDVVEVEGIELAQYLFQVAEGRRGRTGPLLVFDDHNAEYVLQQRAFETDWRQSRLGGKSGLKPLARRWIGAVYSFVQWRRLRSYERRACLAADRVVAVSESDAQALRSLLPDLNPVVVPNGVDMDFYTAPVPALDAGQGPGESDLVFTGKMDFRPNVDAVSWFAGEVLPSIRREIPEVRLWVVGKDPHPRLAPLIEDPAVVVTGWVEDVRPYIAAAAVYVIPLRIGGGTRLKVLEAMAMGKAIVSTTLGCEGFDLAPGTELVIADAPTQVAAAVLALLRDPQRRKRLGQAARRFAASKYDWRIILPRLERAYERE